MQEENGVQRMAEPLSQRTRVATELELEGGTRFGRHFAVVKEEEQKVQKVDSAWVESDCIRGDGLSISSCYQPVRRACATRMWPGSQEERLCQEVSSS